MTDRFVSNVTIGTLLVIMATAAIIDNTVGGDGTSYMVGINAWIPMVLIIGPALEWFTKRRQAIAA